MKPTPPYLLLLILLTLLIAPSPTAANPSHANLFFEHPEPAIASLERALIHWQKYAETLDAQYIKMNIAMQRVFDSHKLEAEVRADINTARNAE